MKAHLENIVEGKRKLAKAQVIVAEQKKQLMSGFLGIYIEMRQRLREMETNHVKYSCPTIQKENEICRNAEKELYSALEMLETPAILRYTLFNGTRKDINKLLETTKYVSKYVDHMLKMNDCC